MKRVLKRLGTLMIICVLCLSQSVQLPLQEPVLPVPLPGQVLLPGQLPLPVQPRRLS